MINQVKKEGKIENTILVSIGSKFSTIKIQEHLDELELLAHTAGLKSKKRFIQFIEKPNVATFVGKGKLKEIKDYINSEEINIVLFDDELTPSQQRNIENELNCKVIDRTNLILYIFAMRARSSYAKTQVELAQYQYLLPRLKRMWTHLEKQRGGIGLRGPGETELETDRRRIKDKISLLKKRIKTIDKQKSTQRKNRGNIVKVALVGYTNVGKSTIMNILAKENLFTENKLFATLDTTVRKIVLNNIPFLLSDTVGFIRKLPHSLIESFKSTLEEVKEADILLHIVDISNKSFEEHILTVNKTLAEINALNKKTILVFNKIDAYKFNSNTLKNLSQEYMTKNGYECVFISALNKENINELRLKLIKEVKKIYLSRYPAFIKKF